MQPAVLPPRVNHSATVILAHGLGDNGASWQQVALQWRWPQKFPYIKFIFPHAPMTPITVAGGMAMPGWYDIMSFDDLGGGVHDEEGIQKSSAYIGTLIDAEKQSGIPESRILLGGFSQGGAISLYTGLMGQDRLAGIFGLSSYLPAASSINAKLAAGDKATRRLPVFMGHGTADPTVRYEWGKASEQAITALGFKVDFKTYPGMGHSSCQEEADDLENFIREKLPPTTS